MQLFLQWTALYERCFFCPWQHTRHLQVSFISRVYVRASPPPPSFPSTQQLGVSGSQPVTLWRARQIQAQHGKHITSVSAWEHLALPGCEGPSVCLSDSEPTHTLLVYTGVVMAPQFLLLHRYWFIIQTINNLYNTKANRLNIIIKHRTILWIFN